MLYLLTLLFVLGQAKQNYIMSAPVTGAGNYGTGCSGGSCLLLDDHWTTSSLNTSNWYPGLAICNNGAGQNCGSIPGGGDYIYPLSGWCWSNINGCQDFASYDYPYGYATNSPGLTSSALDIAGDGSLEFSVKLYSSTTYPTNSNNPLAASPYCTGVAFATANCAFIYWTGAAITSGGLSCQSCYPATVNNTNAIIPINGGLFQWRMRLDQGLLYGVYPSMECDAVGGSFAGTTANANFEFGYTSGAGALHTVAFGINNTANGTAQVSTGNNGVGSGDLSNWHTYALEWTGSTDHQWKYYIDGIAQAVTANNEGDVPTIGWHCKLSLGIAQNQTNGSFHTLWDTGHPGPFSMYVSDAQIYKMPGT